MSERIVSSDEARKVAAEQKRARRAARRAHEAHLTELGMVMERRALLRSQHEALFIFRSCLLARRHETPWQRWLRVRRDVRRHSAYARTLARRFFGNKRAMYIIDEVHS